MDWGKIIFVFVCVCLFNAHDSRRRFRAAIVAISRGTETPRGRLGEVRFEKNDVLLLQVGHDSPLLTRDYFDATEEYKAAGQGKMSKNNSRDDLEGSGHHGVGQMIRRMSKTAISSMSRNSSSNSLDEKGKQEGAEGRKKQALNDAYMQFYKTNPDARTGPEVKTLNDAYWKHFNSSGSRCEVADAGAYVTREAMGNESNKNLDLRHEALLTTLYTYLMSSTPFPI